MLDLCTGTADLAIAAATAAPPAARGGRRRFRRRDAAAWAATSSRARGLGDRDRAGAAATRCASRCADASVDARHDRVRHPQRRATRRGVSARCMRVLRPGGRLAILEFAMPRCPVVRQAYLCVLPPRAAAHRPARLRHTRRVHATCRRRSGRSRRRDEFVHISAARGFSDVSGRPSDLRHRLSLYSATKPELSGWTVTGQSLPDAPSLAASPGTVILDCKFLMYFDFDDRSPRHHADRTRDLLARRRPAVDHRPPADRSSCILVMLPDVFPGSDRRRRRRRSGAAGRDARAASATRSGSCSSSRAPSSRRKRPPQTPSCPTWTAMAHAARARAEARRTRCRSRAATRRSASTARHAGAAEAAAEAPPSRAAGSRRPGARAAGPRPADAERAADDSVLRGLPRPRRRSAQAGDNGRGAGRRLGDALRNLQRYVPAADRSTTRRAAGSSARRSSSTPRAWSSGRGSPLHRAGQAQLVHPVRGDVDAGARRRHVQRAQGRHDHRPRGRRRRVRSTRSTTRRSTRSRHRIPRSRCRRSTRRTRRSSPSRSSTTRRRRR